MIYFNGVSKIYTKDAKALEDINFSVNAGEFISIVGHSGAGKTTLVKLIPLLVWFVNKPSQHINKTCFFYHTYKNKLMVQHKYPQKACQSR